MNAFGRAKKTNSTPRLQLNRMEISCYHLGRDVCYKTMLCFGQEFISDQDILQTKLFTTLQKIVAKLTCLWLGPYLFISVITALFQSAGCLPFSKVLTTRLASGPAVTVVKLFRNCRWIPPDLWKETRSW